jgi:hypothetical protein
VLQGGYPEAISRATSRRRTTWARQYINAIIARDVLDVAGIDKLDHLPLFLRCLSQVSGQMYLLARVDVWARNQLKRVVKTPKLQFIDSGLLATLIDLNATEIQQNRSRFGHVLEAFVYSELLKHTTTAEGDYRLFYYRDLDKFEVDVVIENAAG